MSHNMSQSHSRQAAYVPAHASDSNKAGGGASFATATKKPGVFDLHPPPWRPRLHPGSRQLGAPDIYIRSLAGSTAPEDELSEANVKNGISVRPAVGNETFSAHDMVYDRLKAKAVVQQLGLLFDEVVQRREQLASLRCGPASSQYRQPQRVTLNEVKLAAYVKELADSSVPLRKLARSVPHGYRGERMLDMLWNGGNAGNAMAAAVKGQSAASSSVANSSAAATAAAPGLPNSVAIERAVWFVRVVGASEISSSRLRQANSAAYTTEWTGVLMGWLRRQIVELNVAHHHPRSQTHHAHHVLASTPGHSSNSMPSSPANAAARARQTPQTPQPTLSQSHPQRPTDDEPPYALFLENDFRDRWLAKWRYSVALLRALRYENLIDVKVAAHATLDMLRTANVVQLVVVLALLQEFLDVVADSVTLLHFALDVLNSKLYEYQAIALVRANDSGSYNCINACKELKRTLLYVVDASPDALISPSCWSKLRAVIEEDARAGDASIGTDLRLAKAQNRNERLLSGFLGSEADDASTTPMSERLRDVQILDQFVVQQDIHATFDALFRGRPVSASSEDKIRAILSWSTTRWRSGEYRPFAGATLIHTYVKLQPSRTTQKREATSVLSALRADGGEARVVPPLHRIDVDAVVMAWITDVDAAFKRASAADSSPDLRWRGELEAISVPDLIILIGQLCQRDCFSFQKYLQRLTARGLTAMGGRSSSEVERTTTDSGDAQDSLHTKLLRSIPLFTTSAPLEHQRRTAIYGNRSKESWEEAMERRAVREVMAKFAFLADADECTAAASQTTMHASEDGGEEPLAHFWQSSRYVQSRVVHLHLVPALRRQMERRSDVCASTELLRSLARLLSDAAQFAALREVCVLFAEKDSRESMRGVAQEILTQNRLIWKAMDMPEFVGRDSLPEGQATPKPPAIEAKSDETSATATEPPWAASDEELADRLPARIQSLDALRWRQVLCQVSIAVGALQKAHLAADAGAHGKLQSLARLVCADILGDEIDAANATYALSMLTSNTTNGPPFAVYLLEERVKRLSVQLEATFADETRVRACLRSMLLVQRGFIEEGAPASLPNAAVHALRLVTEWMENNVSTTPVEAGSSTTATVPAVTSTTTTTTTTTDGSTRHRHREEDESLIVRLGVVCGLVQLEGLLATPSVKQLAPRLFCAILHVALTRSRRPDATEARLVPILDVATYVLQQTPYDVQQTMQARALERLASLLQLQPCPLDGAARRIASLIDHEQDNVRPLHSTAVETTYKAWQQQRTLLIEASSCSSAFLHGQFTPVVIKPWDLHPNVETLGVGSAVISTADGASDTTTFSTTEMASLTNNGPISLQHFGAHRTLDRLPDMTNDGRADIGHAARPPAMLHSEQSYGLHLAGESVYARDARRGLLAMHDLGDNSRTVDVKHLVPALQPPPPPPPSTTTADAQTKRALSLAVAATANDVAKKTGTDKAGDGKPGRGAAKAKETFAAPATSATAARKRKTSSAAATTSTEKKAPAGGARKRAKKD